MILVIKISKLANDHYVIHPKTRTPVAMMEPEQMLEKSLRLLGRYHFASIEEYEKGYFKS